MRIASLLATLVLLAAGCGSSDDGGASSAAETSGDTNAATEGGESSGGSGEAAGLKTYDVPSAGFAIGVPESWRALSVEDFTQSGALEEFADENPEMAPYFEQLKSPDSPMKLIAADPELKQQFATNVNVIIEPLPEGTSVEEYGLRNEEQLADALDVQGEIESETVDHPAGEAVRASYRADLSTGGQNRTFAFLQYYFVKGTNGYVVTFTTLPDFEDQYRDSFDAAADSFRFL